MLDEQTVCSSFVYYYWTLWLPLYFPLFIYIYILSCDSYIASYLMLPTIRCSFGMETPRYLFHSHLVVSYAVFSPSPVSDFTVISTYSAPPTYSQLNSAQVFYHSSCVYPFTYLSICSPFFPSTPFCFFWPPPVLLFDHSLYLGTFSSFFVFACEYLCMWFSLCLATSFPSLPLPYLVIFLVIDSTPISIVMTTLYESNSVYNKL